MAAQLLNDHPGLLEEIRADLRILTKLPGLLGMTIASHRKRLGLSQEELEERTHISVRTISRIENGETPQPDARKLLSICIGLGLSYTLSMDLMGKGNWRPGPSVEAQLIERILREFHGCTVDEANELIDSLDLSMKFIADEQPA